MEETFISFCAFRALIFGKQGVIFHGKCGGISHLSFGRSGVDRQSLYLHNGGSCVEILIFNLSQLTAIHSVSEGSRDSGEIDVIHTSSHLFIGCETEGNGAVRDFRMLQQIFCGGQNFGDSSLIIAAQKGSSICDNQILPLVLSQNGVIGRA